MLPLLIRMNCIWCLMIIQHSYWCYCGCCAKLSDNEVIVSLDRFRKYSGHLSFLSYVQQRQEDICTTCKQQHYYINNWERLTGLMLNSDSSWHGGFSTQFRLYLFFPDPHQQPFLWQEVFSLLRNCLQISLGAAKRIY